MLTPRFTSRVDQIISSRNIDRICGFENSACSSAAFLTPGCERDADTFAYVCESDVLETGFALACYQVFRLPPERVFVSVYEDDDDAYALWRDAVGVPETHIHRLGAEDNFWESGPTGALVSDNLHTYLQAQAIKLFLHLSAAITPLHVTRCSPLTLTGAPVACAA